MTTPTNRLAHGAYVVVALAVLGETGCSKTATCRPGTLLVTLACDGKTVAGGADHALLTLSEGDVSSPAQSIALTCPQTNHQVTVARYQAGRTLVATVAIAGGTGPARTIVTNHSLPLGEGCTQWTVAVPSDTTPLVDAGKDGDGADRAPDGTGNEMPDLAPAPPDPTDGSSPEQIIVVPVPDGGLFTNGATCTLDGECASSKCAGGVCCEERCDGKCQVCAAGTGKCSNLPVGTTSSRCATTPDATTCGETGACDDKGGCALFSPTTQCKGASCDGSGLTRNSAAFCDGLGHCLAGQPTNCGAYRCAGGECGQTCTGVGDCNGVPCVDGRCGGKRGVGATCDNNTQCDKGFCVDGVCCESDCSGTCLACSAAATGRSNGTCAPVTAGSDPRNKCEPEAGCGNDGTCDGRGACRKRGVEAVCAAATCAENGSYTKAATCNGLGACAPATTTSCGLYRCNATGCGQAPCASDNDCAPGAAYCDAANTHQCLPKKGLGTACTRDQDCDGGPCVKGICCENACTKGCFSCSGADTGGAMGRCLPVVAGRSDGTCTAMPESSCKDTGACDGKGACQMQPATVECKAESCAASTYKPPSKCDGAGTCAGTATRNCGTYLCDGAVRCKTSCVSDTDCSKGSFCTNGKCLPATCSIDDWCWHHPRPHGHAVTSVWGPNPNDVWAVGLAGSIVHWDGSDWSGFKSVSTEDLRDVHGAGGVVWAVGNGGNVLKWDGFAWRKVSSGTAASLGHVLAISADDAWATGPPGAVLHWNGTTWQSIQLPNGSDPSVAVSARSNSDVWIATTRSVFHWTGTSFETEPTKGLTSAPFIEDILVDPAGNVWLLTYQFILRRAGDGWASFATIPENGGGAHLAQSPSGRLFASRWIPGKSGTVFSWTATDSSISVSFSPPKFSTPAKLLPFSDTDIFLADGAVERWNGTDALSLFHGENYGVTNWSISVAGYGPFQAGIWVVGHNSDSPSALVNNSNRWTNASIGATSGLDRVAMGSTFGWILSGGKVFRGNGTSWSSVLPATPQDTLNVRAMAANSARAWFVGPSGKVWMDSGVSAVSIASGTSSDLFDVASDGQRVWAVGANGTIIYKEPTTPFTVLASGTTRDLNTVCVNSSTDVWIAGNGFAIRGSGSTWTDFSQGISEISDVESLACDGAQAWLGEDDGLRVWRFSNSIWTSDFTGVDIHELAPTPTHIWAVGTGNAILRKDR